MDARNAGLTADPLFVAVTRPPMRWGVTFSALLLNLVFTMEVFLLTKNLLTLLCIPIHGIFALLCLRDPRIFDLLLLWGARAFQRTPKISDTGARGPRENRLLAASGATPRPSSCSRFQR